MDIEIFKPWIASVFLFFAGIFLKSFVRDKIFYLLEKITNKTSFSLDTEIVIAFKEPISFIVLLNFLYVAFSYVPLDISAYEDVIYNIYRSFLIMSICAAIFNLTDEKGTLFKKIVTVFKFDFDNSVMNLFSKCLKIIVIAIAATMIAYEWDYNINGLIAGMGIGGVAIALAAQETLSNFIGGVMLVIDNPFSNGDWIQTGEVEGVVESSSFRSTRVRTFTQGLVTIPNANLSKGIITNWSRMEKRRVRFVLGVTYTTTLQEMQTCIANIKETIKQHEDVDKENIIVTFDAYGANSLDILISYYIFKTDAQEYFMIKSDINFSIMTILEKEKVSVAFPSQSVYFENSLQLNSCPKSTMESAKKISLVK